MRVALAVALIHSFNDALLRRPIQKQKTAPLFLLENHLGHFFRAGSSSYPARVPDRPDSVKRIPAKPRLQQSEGLLFFND